MHYFLLLLITAISIVISSPTDTPKARHISAILSKRQETAESICQHGQHSLCCAGKTPKDYRVNGVPNCSKITSRSECIPNAGDNGEGVKIYCCSTFYKYHGFGKGCTLIGTGGPVEEPEEEPKNPQNASPEEAPAGGGGGGGWFPWPTIPSENHNGVSIPDPQVLALVPTTDSSVTPDIGSGQTSGSNRPGTDPNPDSKTVNFSADETQPTYPGSDVISQTPGD